jgi:hypothetical protein
MATSLEAVSFLKALQWLLSAFGELQMKTQDLGSGDGDVSESCSS